MLERHNMFGEIFRPLLSCRKEIIRSNIRKLRGQRSIECHLSHEKELSAYDQGIERKEAEQDTVISKSKTKQSHGKTKWKTLSNENQYRQLASKVTPLLKVPYSIQLQIKYDKNLKVLKEFGNKLRHEKAKVLLDSHGLPCPLEHVRASPVLEDYRNKTEFCIRNGVDGVPKTVGYLIGSSADNANVECIGPEYLINVREGHKKLAVGFQNYIRNSPLPACIHFSDGGNWKNLIIRSNREGDLMAIVTMHPQKMTEMELDNEKHKLKEFFSDFIKESGINLKSAYFQACPHTRCTHEQAPFELIHGIPHIIEEICGLKFRISPETFFQTNSEAAEVLYDTIKKWPALSSFGTVLDICCGSGIIGLVVAGQARNIIGIDNSSQAILDAKANVDLNGIKNATFICDQAQNVLGNLIPDMYTDNLVAILNPPRQGLGYSAIRALRECKHLKHVMYISCKPQGQALNNFIQLCKPSGKDYSLGVPFTPTLAIPVDLFPHTDQSELILQFERIEL